jgi:hypothetical protein
MTSVPLPEIGGAEERPSRPLWEIAGLRRADLAIALGPMLLGAALRLAWRSGFGLGDDPQLLGFLRGVDVTGVVPNDNLAYRFTWWLPALGACRLFGFTEGALIGPFLAAATLGIGVVYVFGALLAGRAGGLIAALLLIVLPLDFTWVRRRRPPPLRRRDAVPGPDRRQSGDPVPSPDRYGCLECIPRAAELPPGRWRLLFEVAGPRPAWWRPEPLRVWEATESTLPQAQTKDDGGG